MRLHTGTDPAVIGELATKVAASGGITTALDVPTLTGEDIYLKEDFIKLIDAHAVDMIHPDLATAGGILETKKIGDYAEEHGVAMAMHFAGSPISFSDLLSYLVLTLLVWSSAAFKPWASFAGSSLAQKCM